MTSSTTLPASLGGLLEAPVVKAIEAALAPPLERRAAVTFEVELEAPDGTFTVRYDKGVVTTKKGFAKKPLLSVRADKGGLALARDQLQAAIDGFQSAPELKRRVDAAKRLDPNVAAAAHAAVLKLAEGTCIHFDVTGEGRFAVARGAIDEADRELTIVLAGAAVRGLLAGAAPASATATLKGDRSVGTAVLAALAPVQRAIAGLS